MPRWFVTVGSALLLLVGAPAAARADEPRPPEPAKSSTPARPPEPAKTSEPGKPPEPVKAPEQMKAPEPVKAPEPMKAPEQVKTPDPAKARSPAKAPEAAKEPEPPKVVEPERVRGTFRPATRPSRAWGAIAAALLFIPRKTVELIFLASGTTAGLIRDEQVVPRVEEVLSPRSGEITIFPTIFAASRQHTSAGLRVLARVDPVALSLGFGIGGPHDINGEGRFRYSITRPLPFLVDVEGLYDNRSALKYYGLGQRPTRDCRNHFVSLGADAECVGETRFRSSSLAPTALYMERRARAIVSLGVRPAANFELFASSSYLHSSVVDSPDQKSVALSRVFQPGTVQNASGSIHQFYNEIALRFDTRLTSGRPAAGALLEGYGGLASGTGDDPSGYVRVGGRAAVYIPILRKVNILSPQIVIDGLVPALDDRVPFTALVGQPDFRGYDTRRDYVSTVVSLDYRWSLMRYLAARVFADAATVAPSLPKIFESPPRFAAGFGFDLFSDSALLGQLALAFSGDGVTFLASFGLPAGFGDRQHRY